MKRQIEKLCYNHNFSCNFLLIFIRNFSSRKQTWFCSLNGKTCFIRNMEITDYAINGKFEPVPWNPLMRGFTQLTADKISSSDPADKKCMKPERDRNCLEFPQWGPKVPLHGKSIWPLLGPLTQLDRLDQLGLPIISLFFFSATKASFSRSLFLVACKRLYKSLCRSVGGSVPHILFSLFYKF